MSAAEIVLLSETAKTSPTKRSRALHAAQVDRPALAGADDRLSHPSDIEIGAGFTDAEVGMRLRY